MTFPLLMFSNSSFEVRCRTDIHAAICKAKDVNVVHEGKIMVRLRRSYGALSFACGSAAILLNETQEQEFPNI